MDDLIKIIQTQEKIIKQKDREIEILKLLLLQQELQQEKDKVADKQLALTL